MEENKKGSITSVYEYDSVYPDKQDALQRFGKIKIEATSFTVSAPIQTHTIFPLIYSIADEQAKSRLEDMKCVPISIQTISIERIFADKILAAEFYLEREKWFDVAKHVYDIYFMYQMPEIEQMLNDNDSIIKYLAYKRIEEIARQGSDLDKKPLSSLQIYEAFQNPDFIKAFEQMQDIYVFQDAYRYDLQDIQQTFMSLKEILVRISDKEHEFIESEEFSLMVQNILPSSQKSNQTIDNSDYDIDEPDEPNEPNEPNEPDEPDI